MAAEVSSSWSGAPPARHSGAVRAGVAVLGAAVLVIGLVLVFDVVAAVRTLGWLVGLGLVLNGCLELAVGWTSGQRGRAAVLGGVLVAGGLLAAFWPGVTVWALAVLTGISLLLHGIGRLAVAVADRAEVRGWGWMALAGVFDIAIGLLALAWPEATVRVLCLLLGVQVVVLGVVLVVWALLAPRRRPAEAGQL
ncbi:conserved membrane protein of unknown function [Modestobacter italicus]|uniref:HdeD family acid-resistance protein n=1 Tax=Modestobacter italicus (strain DSM 44449 / CECT 9708 / BC 501) TaxID=2732864 RepID=I4EXY2_MODI5|nr:DUF308 domain-containing protein [Modestobacter marinus]CCH88245.1 conserved membrane protein of unknown function [Modestobacter marinus]